MNDNCNIAVGLNANLNPSILRSESEGRIAYPSGNWLAYRRNGRTMNYAFVYHAGDRDVVLNNFVGDEYRLLPTDSNFRVMLREDGKPKRFPEVHMCIPELENEISILSSLHEFGHTRVYDLLLGLYEGLRETGHVDTSNWRALHNYLDGSISAPASNFRRFGRTERVVGKLIDVNEFFSTRIEDKKYKKLHERSAWSFALSKAREFGIPAGIGGKEMLEYATERLQTYGKRFLHSR